jgi:hypothetical protein
MLDTILEYYNTKLIAAWISSVFSNKSCESIIHQRNLLLLLSALTITILLHSKDDRVIAIPAAFSRQSTTILLLQNIYLDNYYIIGDYFVVHCL